PAGFTRPDLVPETILPPAGPWGDWRLAPGVDRPVAAVLERAEALVRSRLAAFGTGADRFGLIHADMHASNVLVDGDALTVIDFDDCGFSWHLYDLATALSFLEARPAAAALTAAWLEGYRRIRQLPREQLDEIEALVILRRLVLLAWVGTHAETELAAAFTGNFAMGSAHLAERFLGLRG
ncbi:MAG TPA: phosphotransferase, partial [Devosiaceae bacterium]|nr:phosphotransferase [Devosiaceae bacterium]